MSSITLTIPLDNPSALLEAAGMLIRLGKPAEAPSVTGEERPSVAIAFEAPEVQAAAVFAAPTEGTSIPPTPPVEPVAAEETPAPIVPGETDINGMPWDDRIHSSSRGKIQSGAWKYKRGVSPDAIKSVESELRGAPTLPPPPPPAALLVSSNAALNMSFIDLAGLISTRGITHEQLTAAVAKIGLTSLVHVAKNPEHIPALAKELGLI